MNECQLELLEVLRRIAMYRRPFSGLLERDQPTKDNACHETKAVDATPSFKRKHNFELKEKLHDKIIPNDSEMCNSF